MQTPDQYKQLLANAQTNQCIEKLFVQIEIARKQKLQQADTFYDSLITLSGEFAALEQDRRDGILNMDEHRIGKQKINRRLTDFINLLPSEFFALSEEKLVKAKASLRELIALDDKRKAFDYDVFISFSHENEQQVREITTILRGYGLKVFIYFESIAPNAGGEFMDKIDKALRTSRHFVLISTPESMSSDTVKMEFQNFHMFVHQKDKKNRKFIIFEGEGFNIDILPLIYRNTDRANDAQDLVKSLIDVQYLNKRFEQEQIEQKKREQKELDDLKEEVKTLSELLKQQQEKGAEAMSFKMMEEAREAGYQKATTEKQAELKQATEQLTNLEKELNKARTQLTELQKQLTQNDQHKTDELKQLQKQLADLKTETHAAKKQITTFQEKIKTLEQENSSLKTQNSQLKTLADKTNESDKINQLNKQLDSLVKEKQIAENNRNNEAKQTQKLKTDYEQQVAKLKEEIAQLKNAATPNDYTEKFTQQIQQLENDKNGLLIRIKNLNTEIQNRNQRIEQLTNQKNTTAQSKPPFVLYGIIAVLAIVLVVFGVKNSNLNNQLAQNNDNTDNTTEEVVEEIPEETTEPVNTFTNYTETATGAPFDMVAVKGGTFKIGDDDFSYGRETITLKDFYMGKTEVTVAQFKAFIDATGYKTDADKNTKYKGSRVYVNGSWKYKEGVNWECDIEGKKRPQSEYNHPVIHVSWNDAKEYCKWLSKETGKTYRLPSEAEWEFAAGGGGRSTLTGNSVSFELQKWAGTNTENELKKYAWYSTNSGRKTHEVATLEKNLLGLHDMSGNVWEWCEDDWHSKYSDGIPKDGSAWISNSRSASSNRVLRGGSWSSNAEYCRVANRFNDDPDSRDGNSGFRVACSL